MLELGPYLGLFLTAFLAGSIVPLASEPALLLLLAGGASPWAAVAVATAGNTLGAFTLWLMGRAAARGGAGWVTARLGDEAARERAQGRMRRCGAPLLLLAWLPWVGDAIALGAGLVGVRPLPFLLLCGAGKLARYAALSWTFAAV
jgi:membrane protein YqaA with SNARE-associated domain